MNSLTLPRSDDILIPAVLREAAIDVWRRNDWDEIVYLDDAGSYYCASAEAFSSSFLVDFLDGDPDAIIDLASLSMESRIADAVECYMESNATVLTSLDPWGVLHTVFGSAPDGKRRDYLNIDETDDMRVMLVDWITLAERTIDDSEPEWLRAFRLGIPLYDIAISYPDCVLSWFDD